MNAVCPFQTKKYLQYSGQSLIIASTRGEAATRTGTATYKQQLAHAQNKPKRKTMNHPDLSSGKKLTK
jgi:hypothetical protein